MNRRTFLISTASLAVAGASAGPRRRAARTAGSATRRPPIPLVVKAQKRLEQRFEPQGVTVKWVEFAFGPPLLEAVNAGAVDYGYTGDAPPIFAQAAHAAIVYVAVIPARGYGQAIVVPADSPAQDARRSQGQEDRRRQGLERAQSARRGARERRTSRGPTSSPSISRPADAAAAFSRGAIDAWSIWDPFFAIAELKQKARPLPIDPKATAAEQLLPRQPRFPRQARRRRRRRSTKRSPRRRMGGRSSRRGRGALCAEASGVDIAAQKRSVDRAEFSFGPLTDEIDRPAAGGRRPLPAARPDPGADRRARHRLVLEAERLNDPSTRGPIMSEPNKPLDVFWFIPVSGDGAYLGSDKGNAAGGLLLSQADRPGGRPPRLRRRADPGRLALRGPVDRRRRAGVPHRAAALPRRVAARASRRRPISRARPRRSTASATAASWSISSPAATPRNSPAKASSFRMTSATPTRPNS